MDFALLLSKDPLNLFGKSKGLQSFVFISNNPGQLILPPLLDIILIYWKNMHVSPYVNLHFLQVENTKALLSDNESSLADCEMLGVLIQSFEDMEYLVFLKKIIDKGNIVDVIYSSQDLHVSFGPTLCMKLF